MANISQVAGSVRDLANLFQNMVAAADVLDKIGSLENATAEAKRDSDAAREDHAAAEKELTAALDKIDEANAQAKSIVAAANTTADGIVADAKERASSIALEAKLNYSKLMDQAMADANDQKTKIGASIVAAQGNFDALSLQVNAAIDARDSAMAEAAAAEDRLAKAQAAIQKLLGN